MIIVIRIKNCASPVVALHLIFFKLGDKMMSGKGLELSLIQQQRKKGHQISRCR